MTDDSETLAEYVRRSRAEQGLPEFIEDPAALDLIARRILAAAAEAEQQKAAS